jgi:hypothetical protein
LTLIIDRRGNIRCLSEDLALGPEVRSASRVNPDEEGWWADLSPLDEPDLGFLQSPVQAQNIEPAWTGEYAPAAPA